MRIAALTLNGLGGWPTLELSPVASGLDAVYGPTASGKTTVAEFLAHALYGQPPSAAADVERRVPDGEAIVEIGDERYRLRRYHSGATGTRLTVSSLDGSAVDHDSVRRMLGGLSPGLLRRLCTISFRQPPPIEWLLSVEFAREFQAIGVGAPVESGRRVAELLARRDTLAKELETRLAGEGRASRDVDGRRRELDRLIGEVEREIAAISERLRSVEAALTETDTRLRYRRLELNIDQNWRTSEPDDWETQLAELDTQISRWRSALAELAGREATVRARLAQVQPGVGAAAATVVDERAWLAVARQLADDLTGEVARLARASTSEQCVCWDAHPRLRPIVETFQRQLDVLAALVDERQQELTAAEFEAEVAHLARSQVELGRQLEYLLERRQAVAHGTLPSRRGIDRTQFSAITDVGAAVDGGAGTRFTVADAEQLEQRRLELEQERFDAVQRHTARDRRLRDLRAQRATVDRQRAALLSARSIEHIQRELATIQQKLQQSVQANADGDAAAIVVGNSPRASDILAKLTDGRLVRLQLVDHGRRAKVSTRDGAIVMVEALSPAERDLVYLSLGITLLTAAAARQDVRLPLLLDEPFLRLDAQATAALAAVLDDLARHGQQILVFTGQRDAADRLASLGAAVHDIHALRQHELQPAIAAMAPNLPTSIRPSAAEKPKSRRRDVENGKRRKVRSAKNPTDDPTTTDRSDAA